MDGGSDTDTQQLLSELQRECWSLREKLAKLGCTSGERVLVRPGTVSHAELVKEYTVQVAKWRTLKDMVGLEEEGDQKKERTTWLNSLRKTLKEAQAKVQSLRGSAVIIEDHFSRVVGSNDSDLDVPPMTNSEENAVGGGNSGEGEGAGAAIQAAGGWLLDNVKSLVTSYFEEGATTTVADVMDGRDPHVQIGEAAPPSGDNDVEVLVQRSNWYGRSQPRLVRFLDDGIFVRIDPDTNTVRGVFPYDEVKDIGQSARSAEGTVSLTINFEDGKISSEYYTVHAGDAQRILDAIALRSPRVVPVNIEAAGGDGGGDILYRHVPGYLDQGPETQFNED